MKEPKCRACMHLLGGQCQRDMPDVSTAGSRIMRRIWVKPVPGGDVPAHHVYKFFCCGKYYKAVPAMGAPYGFA